MYHDATVAGAQGSSSGISHGNASNMLSLGIVLEVDHLASISLIDESNRLQHTFEKTHRGSLGLSQ